MREAQKGTFLIIYSSEPSVFNQRMICDGQWSLNEKMISFFNQLGFVVALLKFLPESKINLILSKVKSCLIDFFKLAL